MNPDWITMPALGTFSGVVLAVTLITQFLKGPMDNLKRMPTRMRVLVIAWAVLIGRRAAAGGITLDGAYLDAINGFLVALTAMGAHAVAKDNFFRWK